jgi:DNA repair protein RadC
VRLADRLARRRAGHEDANMTTLFVREDSGYREASSNDVLTRARALIARRYRPGAPVLATPDRTREFLRLHLGAREHEVFGMICLDARGRLIAVEDLFRGTISSAQVYTREVVKTVLAHNAASVILFHNHPSGSSEPSMADELITRRLKDALACVDVHVNDHVIVGERLFSFAEHGLL